jgi:hypothetical protein
VAMLTPLRNSESTTLRLRMIPPGKAFVLSGLADEVTI